MMGVYEVHAENAFITLKGWTRCGLQIGVCCGNSVRMEGQCSYIVDPMLYLQHLMEWIGRENRLVRPELGSLLPRGS